MTLDRVMNISLGFALQIRSKYLCLYLVSWSFNTSVLFLLAFGRTWRHGESNYMKVGATESSPVLLLPILPLAPIISPLLIMSLTLLNSSSFPYYCLWEKIWIFAPSATKSKNKRLFPEVLLERTLPATATSTSSRKVPLSVHLVSYSSTTSLTEWVVSNLWG